LHCEGIVREVNVYGKGRGGLLDANEGA